MGGKRGTRSARLRRRGAHADRKGLAEQPDLLKRIDRILHQLLQVVLNMLRHINGEREWFGESHAEEFRRCLARHHHIHGSRAGELLQTTERWFPAKGFGKLQIRSTTSGDCPSTDMTFPNLLVGICDGYGVVHAVNHHCYGS